MKIPARLLLAHVRRTWLRTLLTVGSVFIAILLFGLLRSIIVGMETTLAATSQRRLVVQSALSLFAHLPKRVEQELDAMESVKGQVRAITHWTWYGGVYVSEDPKHMWGRFGVDVPTLREVYGSEMDLEDEEWDAFISTRTGCVIGEDLVGREGLRIGSKVPITGNIFPGRLELEVVGIYRTRSRAFDQRTLFFHWDYMNEVSKAEGGRSDIVSTYTLLLEDPDAGARISGLIDAHYRNSDTRVRTLTERAFQAQFNSMWGDLPLYFGILGGVVIVACLMVTANTMFLNARERVREVGILKTLGFTPGTVALATLIEGVVLCIAGGAIALALVQLLDGRMIVFIIASVPPSTHLEGLGITVALGLLSGAFPAWMAHRLNIVDAIRRAA